MDLNIDQEWLLRMADKEGNGIISVGGLVVTVRKAEGLLAKNATIPLRWTTEKPTEEGWYWTRGKCWDSDGEPRIVLLRRHGSRLLWHFNQSIPDSAEWAGPIPMPEEHPAISEGG